MKFNLNRRYALAATAVVLVPLAAGCGTEPVLGTLAPPFATPEAGNNARTAYFVTDGGQNTKAVTTSKARANIEQGTGFVNYKIASNDIHDMSATGLGNTLSNGTGTVTVQALPDLDGNGTQDTFLIVTKNSPQNPTRIERSAAYTGPYTSKAEVDALRLVEAKATYTGAGGITGTMGNTAVEQSGSMKVDVDFAAATVDGEIKLQPNSIPTGHAYDNVTFSGRITEDYSDFAIEKATIRNGTAAITDDAGVGTGSFVGKSAVGMIGTFAKSSAITGSSDQANILGTFYGSQNK